jgi:predicted acylesterase/phospholipase RssA
MKHLGISGGGTKIGGLFGVIETLYKKGFHPDVISGISAGAILSVPVAMGKFEEIRDLVLNITLDDFFSKKPVKDNGSLTLGAIWRAINSKPYLGKQENLEKKILSVISENDFKEYKKKNKYAVCIIGAVDFITGARKYINLKDVDYESFIKLVNASSSLPVFTNGIKIKVENIDTYLFDGGVRDHIATAWVLSESQFQDKITESVSVFSRPEDYKVLPSDFKDKNIIKVLERYVYITNVEISKNDEYMLDKICNAKNIRNTKLFLPRIMKSTYDTNRERLLLMYKAGKAEGENYIPPKKAAGKTKNK